MKSLPLFVLLGATVGLVLGYFAPTVSAWIAPLGEIYVRLMEVIVLPYLLSSLVSGLGSLSRDTASALFRKSWAPYLGLWAVSFGALFVVAQTVPRIDQPIVYDFGGTQSPTRESSVALVDLLVPDNLFEALSQNYIPSVVLMGVIFGIAVQSIERRQGFLSFLTVVRTACISIWSWVIYIAPIGVCALFAGALSNADSAGLAAMSIYVAVICVTGLFLGVWILPMLLTCFIKVRYWDLFRELKDAFLIAFVTSLSVAALPQIQIAAQNIARKTLGDSTKENQKMVIETSLAISYPLAQVGNFFVMVFLLYASYYYFLPIALPQMIELPFVTLLSGIGSPSSSIGTVSFLAEWLNLPESTTDLYLDTMAITRYAQVIASVAGFSFITFLVTFKFYGKLTFRPMRAVLVVLVSVVTLSAILVAGRLSGAHIPLHSESNYRSMTLPEALQATSDANSVANTKVTVSSGPPRKIDTSKSALDRIQTSSVLRVGFNPHVSPFVYENDQSQYVGFDVELMYRFAQDMNVTLKMIPYDWRSLQEDLVGGKFDIAIGGLYITDERLNTLTVSSPYFSNPVALIVNEDRVLEFSSDKRIKQIKDLKIAVFNDPVLEPLAHRLFPGAEIKVVPDYDRLAQDRDVDAAIWTLEQARAWAISNSGFSAVVPSGMASQYLFGYLMPPGQLDIAEYLNFWVSEQRRRGVLSDMTMRWIDPAERQQGRQMH